MTQLAKSHVNDNATHGFYLMKFNKIYKSFGHTVESLSYLFKLNEFNKKMTFNISCKSGFFFSKTTELLHEAICPQPFTFLNKQYIFNIRTALIATRGSYCVMKRLPSRGQRERSNFVTIRKIKQHLYTLQLEFELEFYGSFNEKKDKKLLTKAEEEKYKRIRTGAVKKQKKKISKKIKKSTQFREKRKKKIMKSQ